MARKVVILCVCLALAGCTALIGGGKKKPRSAGLETEALDTQIYTFGAADRVSETHIGSNDGR